MLVSLCRLGKGRQSLVLVSTLLRRFSFEQELHSALAMLYHGVQICSTRELVRGFVQAKLCIPILFRDLLLELPMRYINEEIMIHTGIGKFEYFT